MEKQIEVAVKWWGNLIANGARQDNGDAMTAFLMDRISATIKPPTEEQIQTFRDALTKGLRKAVTERHFRSIYNDYGCDPILAEAASQAGIQGACPPFPVKTCMWIRPERVSVRYGYGAKEQVLWEAQKVLTHDGDKHG